MVNMLEVAKTLAYYYNGDHPNWTENRLHDVGMEYVKIDCDDVKKWTTWVKESVPNSKAFALAVKCYAGSTRKFLSIVQ